MNIVPDTLPTVSIDVLLDSKSRILPVTAQLMLSLSMAGKGRNKLKHRVKTLYNLDEFRTLLEFLSNVCDGKTAQNLAAIVARSNPLRQYILIGHDIHDDLDAINRLELDMLQVPVDNYLKTHDNVAAVKHEVALNENRFRHNLKKKLRAMIRRYDFADTYIFKVFRSKKTGLTFKNDHNADNDVSMHDRCALAMAANSEFRCRGLLDDYDRDKLNHNLNDEKPSFQRSLNLCFRKPLPNVSSNIILISIDHEEHDKTQGSPIIEFAF